MEPILSHSLAALGGVLVGALIVWMLDRRSSSPAARAEKKLGDYKAEVAEHFARTSELVDNMTDSYKAVFDQLHESAQSLIEPDQLKALMAERSNEVITLSRLGYNETPTANADDAGDKAEDAGETDAEKPAPDNAETGAEEGSQGKKDKKDSPEDTKQAKDSEDEPAADDESPAGEKAVDAEKTAGEEPDDATNGGAEAQTDAEKQPDDEKKSEGGAKKGAG